MAYAQDTIISANAANDLAVVLNTLLIEAGWTVVETLNPSGTNTPTTKVYKSDGTINACGYDWYVALMYKQIGTEAQMEIMGGGAYDATTHILSEIAGGLDGTGSPSYSEPTTGAVLAPRNVNVTTNTTTTISSHGSTMTKPWFANIIPSSAFGYWASVTLDHVALYTTITVLASNSPSFIVATLNVDPTWTTLGFPVNDHPVMLFGFEPGLSAAVPGTGAGSSDYRNPYVKYTKAIGALLPTLDNFYLPAYAWRPEWYLQGIEGAGAPWAQTGFGDGYKIGTGIDFYVVSGGSIGDTVEIAGQTYAISGALPFPSGSPITQGVDSRVTIAVLVEA